MPGSEYSMISARFSPGGAVFLESTLNNDPFQGKRSRCVTLLQ
jgi:hypothetical protein